MTSSPCWPLHPTTATVDTSSGTPSLVSMQLPALRLSMLVRILSTFGAVCCAGGTLRLTGAPGEG
jgi:hypothetical protein